MWVKFNSTNGTSRRIADQNLTATFNKFVHLMWHPGVIDIELEIVQKLSSTLQADDSFQETPELSIPDTKLTLKVPDCFETRRKMTSDFVNASSVYLKEALRQAPKATKSHLHEYIRKKEAHHEEISTHAQQVLHQSGLTVKDLAYNVRTKYAGEVKLMLKMMKDGFI